MDGIKDAEGAEQFYCILPIIVQSYDRCSSHLYSSTVQVHTKQYCKASIVLVAQGATDIMEGRAS